MHTLNVCVFLCHPFFVLGGWPSADWGENWPGSPLFGNLHVWSQDIHWHPQPNPESCRWPQSVLLFQPSHLGQQARHRGWHINKHWLKKKLMRMTVLINFRISHVAGPLQKMINFSLHLLRLNASSACGCRLVWKPGRRCSEGRWRTKLMWIWTQKLLKWATNLEESPKSK